MKTDRKYFWGFTIVILRVPDIFSDAISALSNFGYEYKISKQTLHGVILIKWFISQMVK